MEQQHRRLLNRRRVALLDNLQVEPVLEAMKRARLFSDLEVQQILEKGDTAKQRIIMFLDKVKRCGPTAFAVLLEVLRAGQPHLADLLSIDPGEDESWSQPSSKSGSRQVSQDETQPGSVHPHDVMQHLENIRPGNAAFGLPTPAEECGDVPAVAEQGGPALAASDLPASKLAEDCRAKLCALLDRKHPFEDDWRRLYTLLHLPDEKRCLLETSWESSMAAAGSPSNSLPPSESPTEQTLFVWQGKVGDHATVGALIAALLKMERRDAVDLLNSNSG